MKKELTTEQLCLVRDTFANICETSLEHGRWADAQEELDLINAIQENLGDEPYKDLTAFEMSEGADWSDWHEREMDDTEWTAVDALIEWVHSEENEPTEALKHAIETCLEEYDANSGMNYEEAVKERLCTLNHFIILAMRSCSPNEIRKIGSIKEQLAEELPEHVENRLEQLEIY